MSRSNQQPLSRPEPIRDPAWKFTWGKYKGNRIDEVIACDRQYVEWCMGKFPDFDVDAVLFDDIEDRYQEGMRQLFGTEKSMSNVEPNTGEVFD